MRICIYFLGLLFFASLSFAEELPKTIKGINYDPMHSFDYAKAIGLDDKPAMEAAIEADLNKFAELKDDSFPDIHHLKTYFTVFASSGAHGMVFVNIADIVNHWNQQHAEMPIVLALGVPEFRPHVDACADEAQCKAWTKSQLDAAIDTVNKYPNLIDRIIVGNEDIQDTDEDVDNVRLRIADDIQTIKNALKTSSVKVGTAQKSVVVNEILELKYKKIIDVADFIGTNIYPFFGQVPYGSSPYSANFVKTAIYHNWYELQLYWRNRVLPEKIITEEGWPSAGEAWGGAPDGDFEHDYFYFWYFRDTQNHNYIPASYYFSLFDKLPGMGVESHWGVFSADRASSLFKGNTKNDFSKPLGKGHIIANFKSTLGKTKIMIDACLQNGRCYPIYGLPGLSSMEDDAAVKEVMIDTTGTTYASIVVRYGSKSCSLNAAALKQLTSQSTIILRDQSGSCAVTPV